MLLFSSFLLFNPKIFAEGTTPNNPQEKIELESAHGCVITATGGVKCWGNNVDGIVGDGTKNNYRLSPTQVIGLTNGVKAISTASNFSCAILETGAVKCWGLNNSGQLGDNTTVSKLEPNQVDGLTSGVIAIATGGDHACALLDTGAVKCWGGNYYGQVGDNTSGTNRLIPTQVNGLTSGVKAISLGGSHSCAILETGAVKCWGWNNYGQIGDSSSGTNRISPTQVTNLTSGVKAIKGGSIYTCALLETGAVKCWGNNNNGQIGDGTTGTNRLYPIQVNGLTSGVKAISAGYDNSCALLETGAVKCWGNNNKGQLGNGNATNSNIPVNVLEFTNEVNAISGGYYFNCALLNNGDVKCWGSNDEGELANGSASTITTPTLIADATSEYIIVKSNYRHSCGLTTSGAVKCWGNNNSGRLGDGTTVSKNIPTQVYGLTSGVVDIAVGNEHSCAVLGTGAVKCWGENNAYNLGDGTVVDKSTPTQVSGLTSGVSKVVAGYSHTCVLLTSGGVKCWGSNSGGAVGNNSSSGYTTTPVTPTGLSSGVIAISSIDSHTCVLLNTGGVKCWGNNYAGQVGDGTTNNKLVPTQVSGLTSGVSSISAGAGSTCALLENGNVKCWGDGSKGQLGFATAQSKSPTSVPDLANIKSISVGSSLACAINADNSISCWGDSAFGKRGDGEINLFRWEVVDASKYTDQAMYINVGFSSSCAISNLNLVKCWGSNYDGQLGHVTIPYISSPTFLMSEAYGYVPLGNVIADVPTGIVPVLTEDWSTDLSAAPQIGVVNVGVRDTGNKRIATFDVDFTNELDWTNLTAETSGVKSLFHYPGGFTNLPGAPVDSTYTLFIPKGDGDKVWICPGASSLEGVSLSCSGGYFLSENQTYGGATATVSNEDGVNYWKVSGLTGTGGMSVVTGLKDTLSRLQVSSPSDHTITFGTNNGLTASGQFLVLAFDPTNKAFDLSTLTLSDINLTDNVGVDRTIASSADINTWGVEIDSSLDTITFFAPTSGTGYYPAASQIVVKIGTNAGGLHQIVNPSSTGSYQETIYILNSDMEGGSVQLPIIDSDRVNVTGYVTAYMHFDIDTGVGEVPGVDTAIDCNFNTCRLYENSQPALANYTVDLGELTSAVVNKSNGTSVAHSDGGNGIINSIYFDISTNAPSGAVVTVKSDNGGLQGPGTNKIPSIGVSVGADGVTRADGEDIPANSGVYGYNLPVASSQLHGSIVPNSLCDSAVKFCGPALTPKTVFTTNSLPVDTARVRMDLAAAANYTNNPGLYTDTLTFIATATF